MFISPYPKPVTITLHGKRDFAGVIRLRILRWQGYCELNVLKMIIKRGTLEESEYKSKDGATGFEDGGRGPKPRNAGSH